MDSATIQRAIREADARSFCRPHEGDCGAIARAIHGVFSGEYIVVKDASGHPRHAAVYIDGEVYDGSGRIRVPGLVSLFVDPYVEGFPSRNLDADATVDECPYLTTTATLSRFVTNDEVTREVERRLQSSLSRE